MRFEDSIPIAGPWVTDAEIGLVTEAAETAWYGGAGSFVRTFESEFANYVERRFAVALPSCTSGLHLALLALDVGPGDEVIVPDATWIASAAPVSYVGATPTFADIDPSTWCLDITRLDECLTPRTKAVIAVDLYGSMPDMIALTKFAAQHGLEVIEDAAEAIGSTLGAKPAGSFGRASVFSFHGSKTLTTGEGGMLVTDDSDLFDRISFLRDHGRVPGDTSFANTEVAYKYKMSDLQAAFGIGQLRRIDELIARKREIFDWYRDRLEGVADLVLNAEPEGTQNSYWMVTVVLSPERGLTKEELGRQLASHSISTRPFFNPLSSLAAYESSASTSKAHERNYVTYQISPYGLNLPSALSLRESEVDRVCDRLREVLA